MEKYSRFMSVHHCTAADEQSLAHSWKLSLISIGEVTFQIICNVGYDELSCTDTFKEEFPLISYFPFFYIPRVVVWNPIGIELKPLPYVGWIWLGNIAFHVVFCSSDCQKIKFDIHLDMQKSDMGWQSEQGFRRHSWHPDSLPAGDTEMSEQEVLRIYLQ